MGASGSGGRNRKPAALRRLEGDRRKLGTHKFAASLKREPVAPGRPICPDYFTPNQQRLWDATITSAPKGLLTAADTALIEVFVVGWDMLRQVNRQISETGLLVHGERGDVRNPLLLIKRQATADVQACAGQLGMSSWARSRLVAPATEDEDPMALLLGWDGDDAGQRTKQ